MPTKKTTASKPAPSKITKTYVEKLIKEAAQGLVTFEENIHEIIRVRAWNILGYDSFIDLWNDRFPNTKLNVSIRGVVIDQMFQDGATDREVSKATKVTVEDVKHVRRKRELGMSPVEAGRGVGRDRPSPVTVKETFYWSLPVDRNDNKRFVDARKKKGRKLTDRDFMRQAMWLYVFLVEKGLVRDVERMLEES